MIFRPALHRAIIAGRKTQTRRPVKPGQTRCRYEPGRTYAIQPGRGQPSDGHRIHILDVHQEHLGDITFTDARAEGFKTTQDFKTYWVQLHDKAWAEKPIRVPCDCWTHSQPGDHFRLRDITERDLLQRFDQRHANTTVWVITFAYDTSEQPRFLAARSEHGYTSNRHRALPDEPEAVNDLTLRRYARDAQAKPRITQQQVWQEARHELEKQIARLERNLDRNHRVMLRAMRRQLDRLDHKINRAA